ncbi:beta-galactosidase GalA [Pedobacter fastidiosus]|uniref:Glycoside hydrolase family 2 protein n=1 Tax=Pedobacter fastidiosus TaxID=2765361 RepID=A0ABR7KPD4_9SPHI|nr:beta-galactosidase GalA [Pedobacter fastidiosus]MBC6109953.1 glycoside hydrolase family 2 protein [Pedobacter fastidiosus]
MKISILKIFASLFIIIVCHAFTSSAQISVEKRREHILIDTSWRFAFGHPYDTKKDYQNGTGYFSYLAKTGYGDGAADPAFDDRTWRKLNLPHDCAVEQPFNEKASFSHGFKAVGRNFPDASVGWYRKSVFIPASDLGRKISIAFDGVFRNSIVWVNGNYLGTEPSGYLGFEYDITDYLNYGGENVIAVRADVTMEEGWFYEGAGIYRHAWLNKTNALHVIPNGTFVRSNLSANKAIVTASVTLKNDALVSAKFNIQQDVLDATGKVVASQTLSNLDLKVLEEKEFTLDIPLENPQLWDLENPYLYSLSTTVIKNGQIADLYKTPFGIRTIRFDAENGFFLNGKRVEIKGTNNHQDHAGVGVALPDELQYFRISKLKEMGSNAYRCSHNPPTVELLEVCDKLGMLVIDENRLMGINDQHLNDVKRLIVRDRNHPSIISWSIGNEEWNIEGNITGARIASTMQAFVKTIDTTRAVTAAISGGIGNGISTVIDLLGYNYVATKNTDEQHQKFPKQFSWGTEEGSTVATRGIYVDNRDKNELAAYDVRQNANFLSLEDGWKHYASRPYLAGMFIWTGFDYRGEPTPFGWPSVLSYFGMLDLCGFPKDSAWFLKSWWSDQPTLHLLPHWNWKGKEGKPIEVWAYSNCDEVELFLNKKSLGKKPMEKNGHLSWTVNYSPGVLEAVGFKNGKKISDVVKTTSDPKSVSVKQENIEVTKSDIAVLTVNVNDALGNLVPTANNEINFEITGPAEIIGVGNGNPTSLEKDQFLEEIGIVGISNLKEKTISHLEDVSELSTDVNGWVDAFKEDRNQEFGKKTKSLIYRGDFELPEWNDQTKITFFYKSIGKEQSIYINGKKIADKISADKKGNIFVLDRSVIKPGKNTIAILATPLLKVNSWDVINSDPGAFQVLKPALAWKRKLFNGFAQVIVQKAGEKGDVYISATSPGLKSANFKIKL